MTIGQRLRAAREANEMSIGDIARRTYIQPKFIQAIDEDNFAVIPDSHRRLFVREYAKLVGVSPEEVLSLLPEFEPPAPVVHNTPVAEPQARRRRMPSMKKESEPVTPAPPVPSLPESERKAYRDVMKRLSSGGGIKLGSSNTTVWLIGGAVLLLLVVAVYYIFFSGKVPQQGTSEAAAADSAAGSPTEILTRNEGDSAAPQGASGAPADDSLTLEGRATGKVWFSIVMDGKRSETGTLDSGGVKVWRAAETFKMSLGNAGGLNLSLNDRAIGTLGPPKTSVRNQIIDLNGVRKSGPARRTAATPTPARRAQRQSNTPRLITPTEVRTAQPPR